MAIYMYVVLFNVFVIVIFHYDSYEISKKV